MKRTTIAAHNIPAESFMPQGWFNRLAHRFDCWSHDANRFKRGAYNHRGWARPVAWLLCRARLRHAWTTWWSLPDGANKQTTCDFCGAAR